VWCQNSRQKQKLLKTPAKTKNTQNSRQIKNSSKTLKTPVKTENTQNSRQKYISRQN